MEAMLQLILIPLVVNWDVKRNVLESGHICYVSVVGCTVKPVLRVVYFNCVYACVCVYSMCIALSVCASSLNADER